MSASEEIEALSTKKPRRRLTPEQRIEERKAEIARIEETQRNRIFESIARIIAELCVLGPKAEAANLELYADRIRNAIQALEPKT